MIKALSRAKTTDEKLVFILKTPLDPDSFRELCDSVSPGWAGRFTLEDGDLGLPYSALNELSDNRLESLCKIIEGSIQEAMDKRAQAEAAYAAKLDHAARTLGLEFE